MGNARITASDPNKEPNFASVLVVVLLSLFLTIGSVRAQQRLFSSYDGTTFYNKRSDNGIMGYSNPKKVLPIPPAIDGQDNSGQGAITEVDSSSNLSRQPSSLTSSLDKTRLFPQTSAPGSYDDPLNGTAGYGNGYHLYGFNPDSEYGPRGIRHWSEPAIYSLLDVPTDARESLFQGACASLGTLPNTGAERSGQWTADGSATFLFPLPNMDHQLLVSPRFGWTRFDFPLKYQDVLGEEVNLYSVGGNFRYLGSISEDLLLNLELGLNWNSDFSAAGSQALRITGGISANVELDNTRRLIFGAMYTGLQGAEILPVAGLQITPNEDIKMDLYFPRPKIARRFCTFSSRIDSSYWGYIAGELDGSQGIFRNTPKGQAHQDYKINYHDWRILLGMERAHHSEINWALEGGLVLGRRMAIEGIDNSFDSTVTPKTSVFFRLKLWY